MKKSKKQQNAIWTRQKRDSEYQFHQLKQYPLLLQAGIDFT